MCAVLIRHDSCGRDVLLLAAGAGNRAPPKQQALFKNRPKKHPEKYALSLSLTLLRQHQVVESIPLLATPCLLLPRLGRRVGRG